NEQGEYYLTDVIGILAKAGGRIEAVVAGDPAEALGINDRKQLAAVAAILRRRILDRLMTDGVTIVDPASTYIDDTVTIGPDTTIHPQVVLEGATAIGTECAIASGCHLTSSRLGDRVILKPYCVLTESVVDDGAVLGPFCHLRPKSHVGAGAEIGNFIELKKARVGRRTKAHHVGYLGDAIIGDHVNIGAGTIFVNYDGVAKHQTTVGDGAFVGSNSSLVAPLTIGEGAYIAAGSVITKDVPADALVLERSPQVVKEGWAARRREKQAAGRRASRHVWHRRLRGRQERGVDHRRGAQAPRVPRLRLRRRGGARRRGAPRPPRRRAPQDARGDPPRAPGGGVARDRPHPLGDPRPALGRERPPPHR